MTPELLWAKKLCRLIVWSALMVAAVANGGGEEENSVVAYWERALHGTEMPSNIRAMVTPLTPEQIAQLLVDSKNLPHQAAAFCKTASIKCFPDNLASKEQTVAKPASRKLANPLIFYKLKEPTSRIPFYDAKEPASRISFYDSAEPGSRISFYDSEEPGSRISFYDSEEPGSRIPFYNPEEPGSRISFYDSEEPGSRISFYDSEELEALSTDSRSKPIKEGSKPPLKISPQFKPSPRRKSKIGFAFQEKQVLVVGRKISVETPKGGGELLDGRAFLPRELAALFPLDDGGLKITNLLGTPKAALMLAVGHCQPRNNGAIRACLTSLEDVADFVSNIIPSSTPIKVYDTFTNTSSFESTTTRFTVSKVKTLKQNLDEPFVTCHDVGLPFRTFYCHSPNKSKSFAVTLQAEDGSVHDRVVICHYDTSDWNPNNLAFRLLPLKPGEGEVCHWLGRTWMGQNGWIFLRA